MDWVSLGVPAFTLYSRIQLVTIPYINLAVLRKWGELRILRKNQFIREVKPSGKCSTEVTDVRWTEVKIAPQMKSGWHSF